MSIATGASGFGVEPNLERAEVVGLGEGELAYRLGRGGEGVELLFGENRELVVEGDGFEELEEDGIDQALRLRGRGR